MWIRWLKRLLVFVAILVLGAAATVIGFFLVFTRNVRAEAGALEDKLTVVDSRPSVIVSADGVELYRIAAEYRKPFTIDDVPEQVREAFISAEDKRFYDHHGVDYIGLARISLLAVQDGKTTQGASTITMQLAKQLVTSSERSLDRKLKDIALAGELESLKTKDQLLELYLKASYFGEGAYGLASAAEIYFGKTIEQLTLSEAAMLARCVRRPSDQNPVKDYEQAIRNRNVVLDIMQEEGYITASEKEAARKERPKVIGEKYRRTLEKNRAPYFVDYVLATLREEMPDDFDLKRGGYRIETSLRMDIQTFAEKAVARVVANNRRSRVNAGSFVLMNQSGEVMALVGGQDYKKEQYNLVTQSRRQPGSSFKPFVYAAGIAEGRFGRGSSVSNAVIRIPDGPGKVWEPKNSGSWSAGSYSIEQSIAYSINRPAIHAYFETGKDTVVQYARDVFGFRTKLTPVNSLALGSIDVHPIELAEAYSVFALKGDRVRPFPIRRIVGPDGQIVKDFSPVIFRSVLDRDAAEQMNDYLRNVVEWGTAKTARSVPDAHGKTGTTNDNRDAWFCGYARNLVGIGWVGNVENNQPMASSVFGGTITIQFWSEIMNYALNRSQDGRLTINSSDVRPEAPKQNTPVEPEPTVPDDMPMEPVDVNTPVETPPITEPEPTEPPDTEPTDPTPVKPPQNEQGTPKGTPPTRNEPEPTGRQVDVEICADSGQPATMYCPETVTRKFAANRVPRSRCSLHRQ